jgi:UDP-2,3-diacylglucosamine pyrophosphatase LpxH
VTHLAIIVVSDLHLGFDGSDKAAFIRFLGKLQSDPSVTDLVFLGDIVDMWRRDSSGVFLENHDVLDLIIELQKKMRVYYVAGNHDFHVLKLQGLGYPINFLKDLTLKQDGVNCRFVHGWEFDEMQREHFMESLCHSMSDQKGERDNNIWAALGRYESDLSRFFSIIDRGRKRRIAEMLQLGPEERLIENLKGVERKARSTVQPNEVLVFGHTHRPFVNKAENLANTGSWVTASPIHNTYVRIEGGKPKLFVFEGAEITERADI